MPGENFCTSKDQVELRARRVEIHDDFEKQVGNKWIALNDRLTEQVYEHEQVDLSLQTNINENLEFESLKDGVQLNDFQEVVSTSVVCRESNASFDRVSLDLSKIQGKKKKSEKKNKNTVAVVNTIGYQSLLQQEIDHILKKVSVLNKDRMLRDLQRIGELADDFIETTGCEISDNPMKLHQLLDANGFQVSEGVVIRLKRVFQNGSVIYSYHTTPIVKLFGMNLVVDASIKKILHQSDSSLIIMEKEKWITWVKVSTRSCEVKWRSCNLTVLADYTGEFWKYYKVPLVNIQKIKNIRSLKDLAIASDFIVLNYFPPEQHLLVKGILEIVKKEAYFHTYFELRFVREKLRDLHEGLKKKSVTSGFSIGMEESYECELKKSGGILEVFTHRAPSIWIGSHCLIVDSGIGMFASSPEKILLILPYESWKKLFEVNNKVVGGNIYYFSERELILRWIEHESRKNKVGMNGNSGQDRKNITHVKNKEEVIGRTIIHQTLLQQEVFHILNKVSDLNRGQVSQKLQRIIDLASDFIETTGSEISDKPMKLHQLLNFNGLDVAEGITIRLENAFQGGSVTYSYHTVPTVKLAGMHLVVDAAIKKIIPKSNSSMIIMEKDKWITWVKVSTKSRELKSVLTSFSIETDFSGEFWQYYTMQLHEVSSMEGIHSLKDLIFAEDLIILNDFPSDDHLRVKEILKKIKEEARIHIYIELRDVSLKLRDLTEGLEMHSEILGFSMGGEVTVECALGKNNDSLGAFTHRAQSILINSHQLVIDSGIGIFASPPEKMLLILPYKSWKRLFEVMNKPIDGNMSLFSEREIISRWLENRISNEMERLDEIDRLIGELDNKINDHDEIGEEIELDIASSISDISSLSADEILELLRNNEKKIAKAMIKFHKFVQSREPELADEMYNMIQVISNEYELFYKDFNERIGFNVAGVGRGRNIFSGDEAELRIIGHVSELSCGLLVTCEHAVSVAERVIAVAKDALPKRKWYDPDEIKESHHKRSEKASQEDREIQSENRKIRQDRINMAKDLLGASRKLVLSTRNIISKIVVAIELLQEKINNRQFFYQYSEDVVFISSFADKAISLASELLVLAQSLIDSILEPPRFSSGINSLMPEVKNHVLKIGRDSHYSKESYDGLDLFIRDKISWRQYRKMGYRRELVELRETGMYSFSKKIRDQIIDTGKKHKFSKKSYDSLRSIVNGKLTWKQYQSVGYSRKLIGRWETGMRSLSKDEKKSVLDTGMINNFTKESYNLLDLKIRKRLSWTQYYRAGRNRLKK